MDGITTATVTAVIAVLIWYLRFTTKQQIEREIKHDEIQKEDRTFNRELITGALKDIHETGLKNAELNRESIEQQRNYQKVSVETLKTICDKLNGGTEGMKAIAKLKKIEVDDRKKKDIEVEEDRRK